MKTSSHLHPLSSQSSHHPMWHYQAWWNTTTYDPMAVLSCLGGLDECKINGKFSPRCLAYNHPIHNPCLSMSHQLSDVTLSLFSTTPFFNSRCVNITTSITNRVTFPEPYTLTNPCTPANINACKPAVLETSISGLWNNSLTAGFRVAYMQR